MRRRRRDECSPVVLLVPDDGTGTDEEVLAGVAVESRSLTEPFDLGEHATRVAHRVAVGIDHVRRFRARSGPRPGAITQDRRRGDDVEVVQTCHVRAAATEELVWTGRLRGLRISGLAFSDEPHREGRSAFVWHARLRTGPFARRAATLHITATPSANLTVLELIPDRRRVFGTRRFVSRGVRSVEELATRIEALALPTGTAGQRRGGRGTSTGVRAT